MPKQHPPARLSKRDIELIIAVLDCAHREDWTVAEVVRHRLAQNEEALDLCAHPDRVGRTSSRREKASAAIYRQIVAETRRIHRLMRRFASWQEPSAGAPRSSNRHHERTVEV